MKDAAAKPTAATLVFGVERTGWNNLYAPYMEEFNFFGHNFFFLYTANNWNNFLSVGGTGVPRAAGLGISLGDNRGGWG